MFALQMFVYASNPIGAHERDRTADLVLTKDVLYQLSYMGASSRLPLLQTKATASPDDSEPCPVVQATLLQSKRK
jgi:hypothetical protein